MTLLAALETLPGEVGFFDLRGRVLHATPGIRAIMGDLGNPAAAAILDLVARAGAGAAEDRILPLGRRTVPAEERILELRGVYVPGSFIRGSPAVVIGVETQVNPEPPIPTLARLLGITHAQARVAILLAQGLGNRAIAEALELSPHTVKRHTEAILAALGISTRAAVGWVLRQRLDWALKGRDDRSSEP